MANALILSLCVLLVPVNEKRIDSLNATVGEFDDRINSTETVVENVSQEVVDLSLDVEELSNTVGQYDEQIEELQDNITETNIRINETDEHHKELRNDFEYLKYDFRSFTNEISKWQIDVDERLNQTETQIQGIKSI